MVSIYNLKDIGYRISDGASLIKAEQLSSVEEATRLVSQARATADEIVADAQRAFEEEKARGLEEGRNQARREAFERLVADQAVLDEGLRKMDADLADVVFRCVRKVVDSFDDRALAEAITRSALKQMRREKRAQLRVPSQLYETFCEKIDEIVRGFPEIELVDVVEDPSLMPPQIILESDVGRVDGDLTQALDDLSEVVHRALTNMRGSTSDKEPDAEVRTEAENG